ncbi:MAG: tRNA (N(6)-L-threonylcarbamoyladenosine(37)-C(2))-methylthiotransferase MtaB [Oligoflexus sp.]
MASVYIKTLGCKVNTYDTHALENQFKAIGYKLVDDPRDAAISILNTCSVTHNADKEARYFLRRFRRENPESLIVATGCYAQTDSQRLVDMREVDLVFPNEIKDQMVQQTHAAFLQKQQGTNIAHKLPVGIQPVKENKQGHFKTSLNLLHADSNQTRAFLKIQDGCNGFCTYCLIPYARGASRSVAADQVKHEVRRLIDLGVKELVFTGIHIGDYGADLTPGKAPSLARLMQELLDWDDMVRIRISSLEPRELSEELLQILHQRRELFCDHFHLPLQSGHDRILKLMRRTYSSEQYADNIAMARQYFPQAMFGADVIPGFPSETDEDFDHTLNFIQEVGLNYLHAFPYSKRPNTAAAKMPGHLESVTIKQRTDRLRQLSEQLREQYLRPFIGSTVTVLWENRTDEQNRRLGYTSNYIEVCAASGYNCAAGQISEVRLKGFVEQQRLLGVPLASSR